VTTATKYTNADFGPDYYDDAPQRPGALLAITLLVTPFSAIANGLVLAQMWHWFVAGTFGVREIGCAQAIGLSLIVGFVTHQSDFTTKKPQRAFAEKIGAMLGMAVLRPALTLGFGAIVAAFL